MSPLPLPFSAPLTPLFACCRFVEISLLALGDLIKACGRYGDGFAPAAAASYEAFDESVSGEVLELLGHVNVRVKRVAAVTVRGAVLAAFLLRAHCKRACCVLMRSQCQVYLENKDSFPDHTQLLKFLQPLLAICGLEDTSPLGIRCAVCTVTPLIFSALNPSCVCPPAAPALLPSVPCKSFCNVPLWLACPLRTS